MPRAPALLIGATLVLGGPGLSSGRAAPQERAPRLENDSYVEADPEAARLLAGARDYAATGRAADAAAAYALLLERAEAVGRAWVVAARSPREEESDPEGGRYLGVPEAVRSDVAAADPELRAIYIARTGPPAARALAAAGPDPAALRAVERRFPATPEAVAALSRLGDAHFEEGRPGRALGCYVRAASHLGVGDPVPARLAARAEGAAAASGDPPAGRLAEEPSRAPAPRAPSEPWSGLAAADVTWAVPAPAEDSVPRRAGHKLPPFEGRRSPAAAGDRVVLQGTTEVVAYDLAPDPAEPAVLREVWRYRDAAAVEQKSLAGKSDSEARSRIESWVRRVPTLPRKSLHATVHAPALSDGRVFALLGGTAPIATLFRQPLMVVRARGWRRAAWPNEPVPPVPARWLVALPLREPPQGPLWRAGGPSGLPTLGRDSDWASPPVAGGREVFAAAIRTARGAEAWVFALEAATGRVLWRTFLAAGYGRPLLDTRPGAYDLPDAMGVSLRGGTLVVSTNLGVLAAVDPDDGTILWMLRYPQEWRGEAEAPHRAVGALAEPPVRAGPNVAALPWDSTRLLVADAADGRIVASHPAIVLGTGPLLGEVDGHLLLAGRPAPSWQLLRSGAHGASEAVPAVSKILGRLCGRGLLLENAVLLPMEDGLVAVEPAGDLVRTLYPFGLRRPLTADLAVAGGRVVVATESELLVFDPPAADSAGD